MDISKDIFWLLFIIFVFLFFIALIILGAFTIKSFVNKVTEYYNYAEEIYDFSTATIIDTHIGYSRYGTPVYYIVYKFSDGTIEQVEVDAQLYYENSKEIPEGF